jgi:hypothetical protein
MGSTYTVESCMYECDYEYESAYIYTYIYIYIDIYIYMCVCVCVCAYIHIHMMQLLSGVSYACGNSKIICIIVRP